MEIHKYRYLEIVPYNVSNWKCNVKSKTITDTSVEGKSYRKKIYYMENTIRVGCDLFDIILDEPKSVHKVIRYIVKNLPYGTNAIELSPNKLTKSIELSASNISTAINRCVELNIIKKLSTISGYETVPKKVYIVNCNYIFNGNLEELKSRYSKIFKDL